MRASGLLGGDPQKHSRGVGSETGKEGVTSPGTSGLLSGGQRGSGARESPQERDAGLGGRSQAGVHERGRGGRLQQGADDSAGKPRWLGFLRSDVTCLLKFTC